MGVDILVGIVILLESEAVANERLEVYHAARYIVDSCLIVLVAIHHRAYESQLVLAKVEHAKSRVLGKDSHNNDVAALFDSLHKRAY